MIKTEATKSKDGLKRADRVYLVNYLSKGLYELIIRFNTVDDPIYKGFLFDAETDELLYVQDNCCFVIMGATTDFDEVDELANKRNLQITTNTFTSGSLEDKIRDYKQKTFDNGITKSIIEHTALVYGEKKNE